MTSSLRIMICCQGHHVGQIFPPRVSPTWTFQQQHLPQNIAGRRTGEIERSMEGGETVGPPHPEALTLPTTPLRSPSQHNRSQVIHLTLPSPLSNSLLPYYDTTTTATRRGALNGEQAEENRRRERFSQAAITLRVRP